MSSSEPASWTGSEPSLLTAGISEDGHADAGDLLDHQHRGQRVGAGAAVLLGHVRGVEVRRQQRGGRLLGVARLLVDVGGVRRHLGLAQGAHRLADRPVLLGQARTAGLRPCYS